VPSSSTDSELRTYFGKNAEQLVSRKTRVPFLTPGAKEHQDRQESDRAGTPFVAVASPQAADVFALPLRWAHYLQTGTTGEAALFAEEAAQYGRKVLVWHPSDLPAVVPFPNAIFLEHGPYQSKRRAFHYAAPRFVDDQRLLADGNGAQVRRKSQKPVVGFCGLANPSLPRIAKSILVGSLHNLNPRQRRKYEPLPLLPATVLRKRLLNRLQRDRRIDARFIIRARAFKLGNLAPNAQVSAEIAARRREYCENVLNTDYTLCVRGYGNWSYRFYETLACGRIPVFVDTDCVLPFENVIDWKSHCVWVDASETAHVADKIVEFHDKLSDEEFAEKQRACRQLWEDRLSGPGFTRYLPEYLRAEKAV